MPSRPDVAVSVGARRVAAALAEPSGTRGRDEWLAVAGDCQSLINTLTAVQDLAIAEAARRESVWCEDGTLGETVHGPGRVSLDAADVVAPVIGASHDQAQRRVEQAVRLAASRVPVPADDGHVPEASGLSGLHQAMAAGRLDGYRAGVIAFELEVAPAHVAEAIVAALGDHLGDEAAMLRRRTRVLLQRISPDLVRERAKRARAATGLRRWVAEPGVDEWHGTFPSEDAAAAWAAIDRLAHDLVAAGTCTNIEQARGKALTDLVTGNATVDVQVVLTVPADTGIPNTAAAGSTAHSMSPVTHRGGPTSVDGPPAVDGAQVVAATVADQLEGAVVDASQVPADVEPAHPHTAADDSRTLDTSVPDHPHAGVDASRLPATVVPDHPQAADIDGSRTLASPDPGPPHTAADDVRVSGHDDLVEVQGARPSEPLLVRRGWLRDHLSKAPPPPRRRVKRAGPLFAPCDPLTGARLDPGDHLATDAYRPGDELAALVRARDGRCRFPGCSVAARFCDLDHVRPWPIGRTAARNLLTLCRRHHRIKQRPGWRVRLALDGTATWTDPTGRVRTTAPLDALASLVLTADTVPDRPPAPSTTEATPVATAWSALETHLQLRLEHQPHAGREQHLWLPPSHRRCTSAADLRAGLARRRAGATTLDAPPF